MAKKPMAIIIVEDDTNLRTMYLDLLSQHQYAVTAYTSAEEALNAFEHETAQPDLMLLDYQLPGMKADAFLAKLQQKIAKSIPTIVLTALAEDDPNIVAIGQHPWVKTVLHKTSSSVHQLLDAVSHALNNHRQLVMHQHQ